MTPEEERDPDDKTPPDQSSSSQGGDGETDPETDSQSQTGSRERDYFDNVFEPLNRLPRGVHEFQAPEHQQLVWDLLENRLLVLKSYGLDAAFSAGFRLTSEPAFDKKWRGLMTPAMGWSNDPLQQDVTSVIAHPHVNGRIVLASISRTCIFLDSVLNLELGKPEGIARRLGDQNAYLILALDDELWRDDEPHRLPAHSISHFSYLLTTHAIADPETRLGKRFDIAARKWRTRVERKEMYERFRERVAEGLDAVEAYIRELESGPQALARLLPPPSKETISMVEEGSLARRTALFVAAFFPDLGETEFDALVVQLLGAQIKASPVERRIVDNEGKTQVVTETHEERWAAIYERDVDDIVRDCQLTVVRRDDGPAIVDFAEPHLRRNVRDQLRNRHSRFVRRQVEALQSSGLIFADLSDTALDGLIRLFVERACEEPRTSGEAWLNELVTALRARLAGEPPEGSVQQQLGWLIGKALAEMQLRRFLYGRMSLLIREMLDRSELRPMVSRIFTALIASNREEALLEVVLSLVQQLRFAPHFDPLEWLRRLLDQANRTVRDRTEKSLLALAAQSGSKGSAVSATIRSWLPDAKRLETQFSASQVFALTFLYRVTYLVNPNSPERESVEPWANRLPFFTALVSGNDDARLEVRTLIQWLLDSHRAWHVPEKELTPLERDQRQAERVSNVIETWIRALTGARPASEAGDNGNGARGKEIVELIVHELGAMIPPDERLLILRHWQQVQDDCRRLAVSTEAINDRARHLRRERTLADLSRRLAGADEPDHTAPATSETRPLGEEGTR